MANGFIREQKDIKYLILYSMTFIPYAIGESDLLDAVLIDDGFGYFEFAEAFHALLESRHIAEIEAPEGKQYVLTPKGQEVIEIMAGEMKASVRDKAENAAIRIVTRFRRDSAIKTSHTEAQDGKSFDVTLAIFDKSEELMSLKIKAYSPRQCMLLEENFKRNAERLQKDILNLLMNNSEIS